MGPNNFGAGAVNFGEGTHMSSGEKLFLKISISLGRLMTICFMILQSAKCALSNNSKVSSSLLVNAPLEG